MTRFESENGSMQRCPKCGRNVWTENHCSFECSDCGYLEHWKETKDPEERIRMEIQTASIEEEIEELPSAGWIKLSRSVWQAPDGGYFRVSFSFWTGWMLLVQIFAWRRHRINARRYKDLGLL